MSNLTVDRFGNRVWVNSEDERHRLDGAAVEWCNGDKEYWVNGKRHRLNGPAIEYKNGERYWYKEGKIDREDGPAVEDPILKVKVWFKNGIKHREDGAAVEHSDGSKEYWINGVKYTEEEYWRKMDEINNR